jgi:hypothetical protein
MAMSGERLERFHRPMGALFPDPDAGREAYRLSNERVALFRENGFVAGGRVRDARQIEALREGLEDIRSGRNPRTRDLYEIDEDYRREPDRNVFHFLGAWLIDEAFHDLPMEVAAGECLFHDAHTMHGSYGNASDRPRRGLALNFMKPDTRCADGRAPLLAGVPLVPEGAIVEGDHFPIV